MPGFKLRSEIKNPLSTIINPNRKRSRCLGLRLARYSLNSIGRDGYPPVLRPLPGTRVKLRVRMIENPLLDMGYTEFIAVDHDPSGPQMNRSMTLAPVGRGATG